MKQAILIALPGTSSDDGAGALAGVDELFRRRFPGTRVVWAFTSSGVRRKLEQAGKPMADPSEALAGLCAHGITRVVVKSLHFAGGMEYSELVEVVSEERGATGRFESIAVSAPLLDSPLDFERTLRCLLRDLPDGTEPDDALLLLAHGSRRPEAQASYATAADVCGRLDRRVILSTLLMNSGFADVIEVCKGANLARVVMAPLMVFAGTATRNDLVGPGPDSLASLLRHEGIRCVPMLKGLGENRDVIRIWMDDVERMLTRMVGVDQKVG